jgi:hypothetical protein
MANHSRHLALALLLLGVAASARADAGNGIRVGGSEGRLHPFIELQGGWDSNVLNNPGSTSPVGEFVFHVRPGLTLSVPAELASVDLSANLDWAQYQTRKLSQLYAAAKLGVSLNPKGMVGLQVDDQFRRSDRSQILTARTGTATTFNGLDVHVPIKPGGGALTVMLSGNWTLESYQVLFKGFDCPVATDPACDFSKIPKLGYNEVSGGAGISWRFLPRTSVLLEGNYFERIPNDKTVTLLQKDPAGYRVLTGLTGLVTPRFTVSLKGGYGSSVGLTPSLGTWLAILEGEWVPGETTSVKGSYAHDLGVDPTTPLYQTHRLALTGRQLVAGRISLGGRVSFDVLDYQGGGSTDVFSVSPTIGYEVTRWLHTEASVAYTDRSSSNGVSTGASGIGNYSRTEAWLKLVGTY